MADFAPDRTQDPPWLHTVLPRFAQELRGLLESMPDLAAQVPGLRIVGRCPCGDHDCATFYTVPRPAGPWELGLETIALAPGPAQGIINIDLVDGRIVAVEVLDRDDVREALNELCG
jgi:hypothetical protein